jgi:hypothetical protein
MNLGMSGAIGGLGQGLTEAAKMSQSAQMEQYKMEMEEAMRERVADRMASRGAQTLAAKQQWNAQAASKIQSDIQGQNAQTDANTINANFASNVSPTDAATANAGNPLNEEQRKAYNMPERSPLDESRQMVLASLKYGDPDVTKGFENLQQSDIASKNAATNADYKSSMADVKMQLAQLKEDNAKYGKDAKPTANHQDWQDWAAGEKAKNPKADTSWGAWYSFKSGQLLKQQALIAKVAGTVPINQSGADKLQGLLNGDDQTPAVQNWQDYDPSKK